MMAPSHVVLLLGYASLLPELVLVPVPSVASTWQAMPGQPTGRWAAAHLLPTILAVGAFLLPGLLALWPDLAARIAGVSPPLLAAAGVAFVFVGRALTLAALVALRRVPPPPAFVAHGPYAVSRNPALLGLHLFFLGGVAMFPGWVTAGGWLLFVGHMHRRVRAEERHLRASAGQAYAAYVARVPRYVPAGRSRVPR